MRYTQSVHTGSYHTETQQLVTAYLKTRQEAAVSVQDIMNFLQEHGSSANITTVYRILDRLETAGLVMKHSAENAKKALFQYIGSDSGCMHHLHVQCTQCGKIIHLDCPEMDGFIKHVEAEHGMQIVCATSQLYGICNECRNKAKQKAPTDGQEEKRTER